MNGAAPESWRSTRRRWRKGSPTAFFAVLAGYHARAIHDRDRQTDPTAQLPCDWTMGDRPLPTLLTTNRSIGRDRPTECRGGAFSG